MKVITKRFALKHKLFLFSAALLIIFVANFVLCRKNYVPPNRPERFMKVGEGHIEPHIVSKIAFSHDGKYLYAIQSLDKESMTFKLFCLDLATNKVMTRIFEHHIPGASVLHFDTLKDKIFVAAIDWNNPSRLFAFSVDLKADRGEIEQIFGSPEGKKLGMDFPSGTEFCGIRALDACNLALKISIKKGNDHTLGSYVYNLKTQELTPSNVYVKLDGMSPWRTGFQYEEQNVDQTRRVRINLHKPPFIQIVDKSKVLDINDGYKFDDWHNRINSVAICNEKDYFAIVSSAIKMEALPLSFHYLVHPVENYTTVALYRYSTGERVFCESYPNYPSYVCKISPDDKWLAVTVGGCVYVYDIDEVSQTKK